MSKNTPDNDKLREIVAELRAGCVARNGAHLLDDAEAMPNITAGVLRRAADLIDSLRSEAAATSSKLKEVEQRLADVCEAAEMGRARLQQFASAANAGHAQAGGRELSRKIWGAFAELDELLPDTAEQPADAHAAESELTKLRDGWRTIDSAPKDGTAFIGAWLRSDGVWRIQALTFWKNLGGWLSTWDYTSASPTHWMPLPAPPSTGQNK